MSTALLFSVFSSLAYTLDLGFFVVLHILPTGYNPIRHAVSDYAIGKYRRWFQVRLWLNALGSLALAGALFILPGTPPLALFDLIFLILLVPARLGVALFPTDLEGKPRTRSGILHYLFAIISFALVYTVVRDMTPVLQTSPAWSPIRGVLCFLAILVLPALIAVIVTLLPALRRIFGLFERIFLLTTTGWLLLVSVFLLLKVI